jgi:sugar/nucleoside kinase (ribokinase family)
MRARGALYGLAIGDALGMPTQLLSRREITERWGALPVLYCGGHGTGPWGEMVRAALAAEDIGWLREPDPDLDTGFDVALVEADGERTFITHLGAESLREPDAWNPVRVRPGDAVYVSGYGLVPPASGAVLGAWAAALLTGTTDPAEAARRLIRRTGHADVIVRTGPDGAVLALRVGGGSGPMDHGLSLSQIPAPTVTAVDTTGAGTPIPGYSWPPWPPA